MTTLSLTLGSGGTACITRELERSTGRDMRAA